MPYIKAKQNPQIKIGICLIVIKVSGMLYVIKTDEYIFREVE
jgi:hypothetical protein